MTEIDRVNRDLNKAELVATDTAIRGLAGKNSVARSGNKFVNRGENLRSNMKLQANRAFKDDEQVFLTDNVFSQSDLRLPGEKKVRPLKFVLPKFRRKGGKK